MWCWCVGVYIPDIQWFADCVRSGCRGAGVLRKKSVRAQKVPKVLDTLERDPA